MPNHTKDMQLRECGAQQHSAKAWLQGYGKSGHLNDRFRQKAPRRNLTFTFTHVIRYENTLKHARVCVGMCVYVMMEGCANISSNISSNDGSFSQRRILQQGSNDRTRKKETKR